MSECITKHDTLETNENSTWIFKGSHSAKNTDEHSVEYVSASSAPGNRVYMKTSNEGLYLNECRNELQKSRWFHQETPEAQACSDVSLALNASETTADQSALSMHDINLTDAITFSKEGERKRKSSLKYNQIDDNRRDTQTR